MAVRIRSLAISGPVVVPLSSGGSLRLSPGETSEELPEVEVANNAKIDKLRERRLLDVETTTDEKGRDAGGEPEQESESGSEQESDTAETGGAKGSRRSSRSRQQ